MRRTKQTEEHDDGEKGKNYLRQNGTFGIGVNQGRIEAEKLAGVINESNSYNPSKASNPISPVEPIIQATDHAQRFMFTWQFMSALVGLILAIFVLAAPQLINLLKQNAELVEPGLNQTNQNLETQSE